VSKDIGDVRKLEKEQKRKVEKKKTYLGVFQKVSSAERDLGQTVLKSHKNIEGRTKEGRKKKGR